jgi:hypothetical protein
MTQELYTATTTTGEIINSTVGNGIGSVFAAKLGKGEGDE